MKGFLPRVGYAAFVVVLQPARHNSFGPHCTKHCFRLKEDGLDVRVF